jgi:hypothetical protein
MPLTHIWPVAQARLHAPQCVWLFVILTHWVPHICSVPPGTGRLSHLRWQPVPTTMLAVQALLSVSGGHDVGQLPSHISPGSTTRLPQEGLQSLSMLAFAPKGQQVSLLVAVRMGSKLQRMPHALGARLLRVQAMKSSHCEADVGHRPSQNSPRSMMRLPHMGLQSLSLLALPRPAGQQPSPLTVRVIGTWSQRTLQFSGEPVVMSWVHGSPSSQEGHGRSGLVGSHSSPSASSTTPLPQLGEHSASSAFVQPDPQQPSPVMQTSTSTMTHVAEQLAASPTIMGC